MAVMHSIWAPSMYHIPYLIFLQQNHARQSHNPPFPYIQYFFFMGHDFCIRATGALHLGSTLILTFARPGHRQTEFTLHPTPFPLALRGASPLLRCELAALLGPFPPPSAPSITHLVSMFFFLPEFRTCSPSGYSIPHSISPFPTSPDRPPTYSRAATIILNYYSSTSLVYSFPVLA